MEIHHLIKIYHLMEFVIKISTYDETISLWWKFITVMKIHYGINFHQYDENNLKQKNYRWWLMTINISDKNFILWWKLITLTNDESLSLWWLMKIHQFNENGFTWMKFIELLAIGGFFRIRLAFRNLLYFIQHWMKIYHLIKIHHCDAMIWLQIIRNI